MDRTRELYKVVLMSWDGEFQSCNCNGGVKYHLGKMTVAPGYSKLFCFDTLELARGYCGRLSWLPSREVVVKGIGVNPFKPRFCCSHSNNKDYFWKLRKQKKSPALYLGCALNAPVPFGTIYVDAFTPTEIDRGSVPGEY